MMALHLQKLTVSFAMRNGSSHNCRWTVNDSPMEEAEFTWDVLDSGNPTMGNSEI